jgi:flagellar M-ring protein FliF
MKFPPWWDERTTAERWAIGAGVPVFLIVLIVAAVFVLRPSYEVLFADLAPQDLTSIANQLTAQRIAYRIDEEGGRILVNRDDVHDARLRIMEAGIPLSRPVGFELFDNVDFGMTEFTQRINYQRALEGELTRTISALREVDHARLHLVLPENSLFSSDAAQPKAALTLAIRPGMSLSAERISGIQRLIASSVPGLMAANVAIHDDKGASLVADGQGSSMAAVAARVEAKKLVEGYLAQKAQIVLDRAFGLGSAIVIVDADIDQDQRQLVRDEVIPVRGGATGAVTSLRSLHGALGQGIDADSNGEPAMAESVRPGSRSGDITTEVKYEPGRQHETVDIAQGAVKRMTVSVLVPKGTADDVRAAMSTAVAAAIGVNPERGDAVSLQEVIGSGVSESDDAEAPPVPTAIPGLQALLGAHAALFAVAALATVVILFVLGYWTAVRRRQPRLSAQELEQLRREIRRWVHENDASQVTS